MCFRLSWICTYFPYFYLFLEGVGGRVGEGGMKGERAHKNLIGNITLCDRLNNQLCRDIARTLLDTFLGYNVLF